MRRPIRRAARSPFGRLVGHFLNRLVRGAQDASSDLDVGPGFLLGILAAPGCIYCFLLFQKYSSLLNWMRGTLRQDVYVTSVPDKFLLITLAITITGLLTVIKWNELLPDAQDFLNLAPLPIPRRNVMLAGAAALGITIVVVSVDVSAVPAILFPAFVMASVRASPAAFVHFIAVHAACVFLASLFTICSVFSVLGTLAALLPREAFRACSSWVRGILLIGLLSLLPVAFMGESLLRNLRNHPASLLQYLPSVWFVCLYQEWQHRTTPLLTQLARRSLWAVAISMAVTIVVYAVAYRRRFADVLEGNRRPSEQRFVRVGLATLDLFASPRAGFNRAFHRFAVRALLRNEAHRLVIAVSLGLGWLLAVQEVVAALPWVLGKDGLPAYALLAAPLAAVYLLILGLRIAFELPAGVPANWIFRTILDARRSETLPVVRRLLFAFLVPAVLMPDLVFSLWAWGPALAIVHISYLGTLSWCAIELQFAGYRKVPLSCPVPGFRNSLLALCLVQFLGFEMFTRGGAAMERWMLAAPWRFTFLAVAIWGAWHWNRQRLTDAREAGELEDGVTFENAPIQAVQRLNLSDGL